jgi:hypothetical protein
VAAIPDKTRVDEASFGDLAEIRARSPPDVSSIADVSLGASPSDSSKRQPTIGATITK